LKFAAAQHISPAEVEEGCLPTAKEVSMLRFVKKVFQAYLASAEKFGPLMPY
jgi:hypothetical protein